MNLMDMQQCGGVEITGLMTTRSGEEACRQFCSIVFSGKETTTRWPHASKGATKLACFYLFTAAYSYGDSQYGDRFEEFILKNGLGKIVKTEKIKNVKFHPDHSNRAWLWTPDSDALAKWWAADKAKEAAEEAALQAIVVPVVSGGDNAGSVEHR